MNFNCFLETLPLDTKGCGCYIMNTLILNFGLEGITWPASLRNCGNFSRENFCFGDESESGEAMRELTRSQV